MHEIELKFGIAPERVAAVRRAVLRRGTPPLRLRAAYYDTADGRLAAAGIALRLRQEGSDWVQTLKVGLDPLRRLEHNVPLQAPSSDAVPALDPSRHDGTEAGRVLHAAWQAGPAAPLEERFVTDVTRHVRLLRGRGAAAGLVMELALDEGQVRAGARQEALHELEIELVQGSPQAMIEFAAGWAVRLGLWLDVRAKSWRGEVLARGLQQGAPFKARAPRLAAQAGVHEARRAVLQSCLDQVLFNASQIAAVPPRPEAVALQYGAGHVHQLRVGLRRLRSALRLFDGHGPQPDRLRERLAGVMGPLGVARDNDVVETELWPALQAAGAPPMSLAAVEVPALPPLLRDPALTQLWLELLAAVQPPAGPGEKADVSWQDLVTRRLHRWHKRMRRGAKAYDRLDDEERHRLRKQAKRLRYVIEFSASLWPPARLERQLEALRKLQQSLGDWHDLVTAQARFEAQVEQDPAAWFAVGWLRARREVLQHQAGRDLRRWADAPVPWRRRK